MQMTEALVKESGGQSPPDAKTCFGRLTKGANLPIFQYLETQKNHRYLHFAWPRSFFLTAKK